MKYFYEVNLMLDHEAFGEHPLMIAFNSERATIKSIIFKSYEECSFACNEFFEDLLDELNELNEDELTVVWETNPDKSQDVSITPAKDWEYEEILRCYIVYSYQVEDLTVNTLMPIVKASICMIELDPINEFLN
jgi:hypothetical protein